MKDKDLIKKIKELKSLEAAGSPQEGWILANKEVLMSQIQPRVNENESVVKEQASDGVYYWQYFSNLFQQRVFKPVVASLVIVAMMLSYTATVSISNASLPGDTLYPIKTTTEKVQLALTFNQEKKVELQMSFVTRRADELGQLAQKDDDNQSKAQKISQTVQKISKDVESVKEGLGKVKIASTVSTETVNLAKTVDQKTMELEEAIIEVHNSLSDDIKKEVENDIKEAIEKTEEAGTSALDVIVEKHKSGEVTEEDDLISRVAGRIKSIEEDINSVSGAIMILGGVGTSTSTTTQPLLLSGQKSTSTSYALTEKSQQAQEIIEEAKDLLDQKDFSSALEKIQESKRIVDEFRDGIEEVPISESNSTGSGSILGTSTEAMLENRVNLSSSSTTTEETSETTQNLIK